MEVEEPVKRADIKVGEDYAIEIERENRWCAQKVERHTVSAVEKITRRVFTAARWDIGGHRADSWLARITDGELPFGQRGWYDYVDDTGGWVVLMKVLRPWVEHEAIIAANARRPGEFRARDQVTVTTSGEEAEVVRIDETGLVVIRYTGTRTMPSKLLTLDTAAEDRSY